MQGMYNPDFALLDAAVARAREGLRVLDEVARFVLSDTQSFVTLKTIRHRLEIVEQAIGEGALVASRRGPDVGHESSDGLASHHCNVFAIIRANASRVGEALRTLAEFLRLYAPPVAALVEDSRHRLYRVEHTLLLQIPYFWFEQYATRGFVYPVSDSVEELAQYISAGALVVQLRDKTSPLSVVEEKAKALCIIVAAHNKTARQKVLLILNDAVELAARLPVAGVHIGQSDMPVSTARRLLGGIKIIGLSTHSEREAGAAQFSGADYVSIGPVFATATKPGVAPLGLAVAGAVARLGGRPLVAIGGISQENQDSLKKIGIKNIAVISAARSFFAER